MPKFGRREIWKSLGTSRRSDAEALHLKEAAYWAAAFTQAEHLTHFTLQPSAGQSLSRGEVATLARQFFSRAKVQLDLDARGPADIDEQEAENAVGELEWQLSTLRSWANPDAHRLVEEAKQQTLGNGSSGPTDELLAELLRRALVQLGSLQLARLRGDYRDAIDDSFFRHGSSAFAADRLAMSGGVTLGECIDRYQAEVLDLRPVTAKTRLKHHSLLKHIGAHLGRRTPLAEINRSDCNGFRDILARPALTGRPLY